MTKGPESLQVLDALLPHLSVAATSPLASDPADVTWLPEKDSPVMAAAICLGCAALVTGDRTHFGPGYGQTFGGVVIHSPRSIAELLLS